MSPEKKSRNPEEDEEQFFLRTCCGVVGTPREAPSMEAAGDKSAGFEAWPTAVRHDARSLLQEGIQGWITGVEAFKVERRKTNQQLSEGRRERQQKISRAERFHTAILQRSAWACWHSACGCSKKVCAPTRVAPDRHDEAASGAPRPGGSNGRLKAAHIAAEKAEPLSTLNTPRQRRSALARAEFFTGFLGRGGAGSPAAEDEDTATTGVRTPRRRHSSLVNSAADDRRAEEDISATGGPSTPRRRRSALERAQLLVDQLRNARPARRYSLQESKQKQVNEEEHLTPTSTPRGAGSSWNSLLRPRFAGGLREAD